jgi:hypothetical protein
MPKKNRTPINLVKIATSLANQRALWEPLVSYDPVARYYDASPESMSSRLGC